MLIDTNRKIWVFSISITIFALVVSEALNLLLFPALILPVTMKGTAIIVGVVTMPICLWIGRQMKEKAMMSLQLQALVDRDRLTDVATRDFFFARLTEFPNAYGVSLMIDIDNFKQVNDTHGHLAGDDVIHAVAQILRAQIRDVDIVCRFGGEEFIVFLQNATAEEGWVIAERIRHCIQVATTRTDAGDIKVTVSVGGSLKDRLEHVDEAIKRADDCLYLAKQKGRNRTVVDWPQRGAVEQMRAS
ncbi:GGDEF domain-containing protein [Octadecabacter sp. G9-8]|uniref:diguanylate cyclase n=1 Tax=Octadecabacter dasysiphoniae TaxID=2909341 RepID=A0ABS9CS64_9RHOB|nr:GGDEF domain-containing protein [Octadecabacter dasysiphoniae]MCF2870083.1 GGDEF domain-containing protein [Octadecabacter dasysiphoniae]